MTLKQIRRMALRATGESERFEKMLRGEVVTGVCGNCGEKEGSA